MKTETKITEFSSCFHTLDRMRMRTKKCSKDQNAFKSSFFYIDFISFAQNITNVFPSQNFCTFMKDLTMKIKEIQDCLSLAFEYLKFFHQSRKSILKMLLTRLSIVQSYTYSTPGLWTEMDKMGPEYFTICFHPIILNCVHGKRMTCNRGVRQGDQVSPLLFVLDVELLQIVIDETWDNGEIVLPNEESYGQSYPIIPYVDDTLIILPDDPVQLDTLKDIVHKFTECTGLRVNLCKSPLVPININIDRANKLAHHLGCKRESMPFTYLGLPMGTSRPKFDALMPMITRLDKRLYRIASMLSYSRRLVHLNMSFLLCLFLLCARLK